jgi:hypothetical protein
MSFNAKDMTQGGQIANMRSHVWSDCQYYFSCAVYFILGAVRLMLMYRLSWQTFVNGWHMVGA